MQPNHQPAAVEAILSNGWIQQVRWFAEIDSTNAEARRSGLGTPLPALYVADRQTAGRGRLQRSWWSPEGCLMLTLAIGEESLPRDAAQWGELALVSGLAVANTLSRFVANGDVQLKWPNDVYLGQRKIAGILIEATPKIWLVGIGLNVAMRWDLAPEEVSSRATCIQRASGSAPERSVVLVELLEELQLALAAWRTGDGTWRQAWRDRCFLTGRIARIRLTERELVTGKCEGIDDQGRLIVRDEQGVHFLTAGEVIEWQ